MKKIEVIGTGCPKCNKLMANAQQAAAGLDAEVVKVSDINEITKRGVMLTPALAIDGKVVASGKVLGSDDIKKLLG